MYYAIGKCAATGNKVRIFDESLANLKTKVNSRMHPLAYVNYYVENGIDQDGYTILVGID